MRALVTGAAGFVGSHLVRELAGAGDEVFAASLDGEAAASPHGASVRTLALDVTSPASIARAVEESRPEVVYHLAAQASVGASFQDAMGTWEVNATGTLRLFQSLPPGTRLLLVSSAEVYGHVPEAEQPLSEARLPRPLSPYAASKAAAEVVAIQASEARRVSAVVARSFNHTGPGQDVRFALPSFAEQLARLKHGPEGAPRVLAVGNLTARRDYLDVRDVVRAYRLLAERGEDGAVYNVCRGTAYSLQDLVERLVRLSGTRAELSVQADRVRALDIPLLLGDATRLRALGWEPSIPLDATLADLLRAAEQRIAAEIPA